MASRAARCCRSKPGSEVTAPHSRAASGRWKQSTDIAARTIAAIVGGYALTALATALLSRLLPWSKIEASVAAGTASFILYATIVCWAFAARRTWLFCAVLAASVAMLVLLHGMLRP